MEPIGGAALEGGSPQSDALLEFAISVAENEKEVTNVRPRVVFPLVPPVGANLERLVVAFYAVLDQALETDIPADSIPDLATLEKEKQSRHPAIPVAKGVDAKKIETEGSGRDERMDPLFFQASVPDPDQPLGDLRSFDRTDRPEADASGAVRVPLDDVAVSRFERPRIAEASSGDPV